MVINLPRPLNDFADKLVITSVTWSLQDRQELSGLGSGQILVRNLSPRLWTASVDIKPLFGDEGDQIQAEIEALDGALNDFYLYNPRRRYPQSDPTGSILGANVALIASLDGNNKAMTLKGLPAGYTLTKGDFLSFDYGTSPVRRAFHRVVETISADGAGFTGTFEVRPHIRPGALVDAVVTLVKPAMRCFIVPNTLNVGRATPEAQTGMTFQVMQRIV